MTELQSVSNRLAGGARVHISIRGIVRGAVTLLVTAIFAIPLYLAVVNAFKTNEQIVSAPASLPTPFTIGHIAGVLSGSSYGFWDGITNSLIIVVPALAGAVVLGAMAGYYLGRSTGVTARLLQGILLIGLMLPLQVLLVPVSMVLSFLGLQASYLGIILFNIALYVPFAAFIFSGFVKSVPIELEEAAEIDGAGRIRTFFQVVVPLLRPATASVMILVAVWIWNDFLNPMILLGPGKGTTATTGIYLSLGQFRTDYGSMFSVMLLSALPVLVFFFMLQKQFVAGLISGGVKG